MTAIDPAIMQAVTIGRRMVEHAFCGMQDIGSGNALRRDHPAYVRSGLTVYRTDIFGRVDGIEIHPELRVTEGKAGIIDIDRIPT